MSPESLTINNNRQGTDDLNQIWKTAVSDLKLQVPAASFDQWLRDASLVTIADAGDGDRVAVIECRDSFAADWINGRFQPTIGRALRAITGKDFIVHARPRPLNGGAV